MKKKIIVCIAALLAMTFNSCEQADFTPDEGEGLKLYHLQRENL